MSWTDERIDRLKAMWADGSTASQIAEDLGGVSRNAVIGKVHRLGLSGRAKSPSSSVPRVRKPRSHIMRVQRSSMPGATASSAVPSLCSACHWRCSVAWSVLSTKSAKRRPTRSSSGVSSSAHIAGLVCSTRPLVDTSTMPMAAWAKALWKRCSLCCSARRCRADCAASRSAASMRRRWAVPSLSRWRKW